MKKLTIILVAALFLIPSLAFASAVLVDAQGKIGVTVAGKAMRAESGMELPDGSVVDVKSGSASILLESGAMDQLSAGSKYTVGSKSSAGKRTDLGSGIALAMRELAASGEGPTVHGMVKKVEGPRNLKFDFNAAGKEGLHATYPRSTAVMLGGTITFKWNLPVDFKNPVIVVEDATKKRLAVANLRAGDMSFTRDAAKLHLGDGATYGWFLAERVGEEVKAKTARFTFTTLSPSKRGGIENEIRRVKALDMSEGGRDLLIAQIYFQHGMYNDAVEKLEPLYAKSKPTFVKRLLGLSYAKMGLRSEAAKYE